MKTLVVLAAFAAATLAAPALENGSGDFKKTVTHIPQTFKRERKSVQELSNTESHVPGTPVTLPSTPAISELGMSARTFGLKKPIIIKKKPVGYQVYRDSDKVPVDSGETCGSQVQVQVCEGKTKMKSTTVEDFNDAQITEDDVKHSITMAKEALENIQRDLNNVERKPSIQGSLWKHGNSESDVELHQDIEVAREALEHIHKNFGNLESMSLHASTIKNADNVPTASFNIGETEEQRLAQWKEAMDIIQKNVEIARNIEDSFKNAPNEDLFSDATVADTKQELMKMELNQRTSIESVGQTEEKADPEGCKAEQAHEKSSEIETTKNGLSKDDMSSSASTMSEKITKDFEITDARNTPASSSETKTEQLLHTEEQSENTLKEKDAEKDSMISQDFTPKSSMVSDSMKLKEDSNEEKEKNMAPKDNVDNVASSTNEMKSVETEDLVVEEQKNAAEPTKNLENLKTEKQHEMKSSEQLEEQHNAINEDLQPQGDLLTEPSEHVEKLLTKSAEEIFSSLNELQAEPKELENPPHTPEAKMASNEDIKQQPEMITPINHAEQMQLQQHQQSFFHPEMRSAEDLKTSHQQQLLNPEARWTHEHQLHLQREPMAPTDSIRPNMEHVHTVQHPGHRHHIHGMRNHHFEIPSGQEQLHSRYSNFMTQEKSADPDMQAYYMRDNSVMTSEGQRFRWKPAHDGRSAYGAPAPAAPASAPSGAMGVFPNANVGSCGIPLLLSCNPSVVSGSLTKPPPSYSAPAYRTEDEFSFHSKRDVKKSHESLPSTLHRLPSNLKTSTVLVAKQ